MYVAKNHGVTSMRRQVDLMRTHPLGLLITTSKDGDIHANHFPFVIDYDETSSKVRLRVHVPRKLGPQLDDLKAGSKCMVVFQGPEAYITPSWYVHTKPSTGKTVPTWDFATVHCHGTPKLFLDPEEGDAFLDKQLDDLTRIMEQTIPDKKPWEVSEAPENYTRLLKKAIYGLEIDVSRTEAKWKMSQDKPDADINGVISGLRSQGEKGQIVADSVQESADAIRS